VGKIDFQNWRKFHLLAKRKQKGLFDRWSK
jgi:hypothetical protein